MLELPSPELIAKYDKPLPRYTSYPTAPAWTDLVDKKTYQEILNHCQSRELSLYLHLPFCQSQCSFCGCNVAITSKRHVIDAYIASVEQELKAVAKALGTKRCIAQLHWGGGTPTYLDEIQMERVMAATREYFDFTNDAEVSLEADPRWTDQKKLECLRKLGFNRISFGVQDFDPNVQKAINRIHSFDVVEHQVQRARHVGFQSVNIDLIYGLPVQTLSTWEKTLDAVEQLRPDRIALFNFAFVPWMKIHQRRLSEDSFPKPIEKLSLFTTAIDRFMKMGYVFIGLDHFAKKDDELAKAFTSKTLHRNFQGYTTRAGLDLIGIGVSAIGAVGDYYFQNESKLSAYEHALEQYGFATMRGFHCSSDDRMRRWIIGEIFCHQCLEKKTFEKIWKINFERTFAHELELLTPLKQDGLLVDDNEKIEVTPLGRLFIRNIGATFDTYLTRGHGKFSRSL